MRISLLPLFIYTITLSAQIRIVDYKENPGGIDIVIELEPFSQIELKYFSDESRPGELSLPSRSIFIGLPFSGKINYTYAILEQTSRTYLPGINPEVFSRDSLVMYQVSPLKRTAVEPPVKLKGFLWAGKIYCAYIEVNQSSYNENRGELIQIRKLKFSFQFKEPFKSNSPMNEGNYIPELILNKAYLSYFQSPKILKDSIEDWIDYTKTYTKIKTARDGIYRITYEQIKSFVPDISKYDPAGFSMYCSGKKYPIYVEGEQNHMFEPGEYIEFIGSRNMGGKHRNISQYNQPYNEYTGRYTDTTAYFLSINDTDPLRVYEREGGSVSAADTLEYYFEENHYEQDNWFDFSADNLVRKENPFWIENKTWNWHSLGVGRRSNDFYVTDLVSGKEVRIFSKLQSYASSVMMNSHLIGLNINDEIAVHDSGYINKYDQKVLTETLSSEFLNEGINKLNIYSFPTVSDVNLVFFDWYEIEYPRYLKLINDSLSFRFNYLEKEDQYLIRIANAHHEGYTLWKTDGQQTRYKLYNNGNGEITLSDSIARSDKFFVQSTEKISVPVIEPPVKFVNLRDTSNKADYILITAKDLIEEGKGYCSFIESAYNVKTILVDIQDIYNEFSYGNFNPEAVKNFLRTAYYYWQQPSPAYVLLAGDASYDYYRNKEKNSGVPHIENYVPSYCAPVSDNWFVVWDTTGACYPMMNIGRLPVKSPAEFLYYKEKHISFLNRGCDDWNKRYLFFSGGTGNNKEQLDLFRNVNSGIINNIITQDPIGGAATHFFKTTDPVSNFGPYSSAEIHDKIDSSGIVINYLGHSGIQTWDNGIVDPLQLYSSRNIYPLVTDFGCSTGKFAEPDITSFAELFICKGQAIGYIGNSSLGFLTTSCLFPELFYSELLKSSNHRISEAHRLAKIKMLENYGSTGTYQLFALTNTYFGDPLIKLPVPAKPDLTIIQKDISVDDSGLNSNMDSILVNVTWHNLGRVIPDSVTIAIEDNYNDSIKFKKLLCLPVPKFNSEFQVIVPVRNMPGIHRLKVILDEPGVIIEHNELNNEMTAPLFIKDNKIKLLNEYTDEGGVQKSLRLITQGQQGRELIGEFSRYSDFRDAQSVSVKPGILFTEFKIPAFFDKGRIWYRIKYNGDTNWSLSRSVSTNTDYNYLINDSTSMHQVNLHNFRIAGNKLSEDSTQNILTVISGGFNDGKTAVINKDGQTYIPEGNIIGHHICLFRAENLEFAGYRRFDVFSGGEQQSADYLNFLDTLNADYIICIAVNDEGRVNNFLKQKLHDFGSRYIDSLGFRSSWAFIGRRGASQDRVSEIYRPAFTGKARVDTCIKRIPAESDFSTDVIGPSGGWDKLTISFCNPDSLAEIIPIGISRNGRADTLSAFTIKNGTADLSFINSEEYPFIKIHAIFKNKADIPSSVFNFAVKYDTPFELMAAVFAERDTVEAGEKQSLKIIVCNAGMKTAENFAIAGILINNNKTDTLLYEEVNSIAGGEQIVFTKIITGDYGDNYFVVNIDPLNNVTECLEDNNSAACTFYAAKDSVAPEIKITFDKKEILEGDFVSASPEIEIIVTDKTSLPDTFRTLIYMDEIAIPYRSIEYAITTDQKSAQFIFKPQLREGDHFLKIISADASGNSNFPGYTCGFKVSEETRLLDVYNYPNPCSAGTYFTFRLPNVPDKLYIKIFTVTGRLVKQMDISPSVLTNNFNKIWWDGRDQDGDAVSNGVYFYKIITSYRGISTSVTEKLMVVR